MLFTFNLPTTPSYGNPGYRIGSDITQATGRFESGETIVAGGSHELSTDTTATIYDLKEVSNTTLADVDGKRIGWSV